MSGKSASARPGPAGHRARLRQRLAYDAQAVSDYEVLELIIGLGLPRQDTKPLAKELLFRFKSVRGVMDARQDELLAVPGFGPGLLSLWQLLRELMVRYVASPLRLREKVATPEDVAQLAHARLTPCSHEECWVALLNSGNYLIGWECVRKGNISEIPILPRDIVEVALDRRARGIILVHNHPSGQMQPSQLDLNLTHGLEHLAPQLGLRLLDHIIVTEGGCFSILQNRYL